jgi:drug/metabolite transporter (DMT)-like permease
VKDMALLFGAVVLMIYSNVVLKFRATVNSGEQHSASLVDYFLAMLRDPMVWTAGMATAAAMLLWMVAIRRVELSVAQPTIALIFVAVPLAAAYFLDEALPPLRIVGLVLIASGVVLVARTA